MAVEQELFDKDQYIKAAFLIFFVGTIGMAINIVVLHQVIKQRIFSYAFGAGCVTHTLANLGITATFTLVIVPFTLVDPSYHTNLYAGRSAHLNVFFYFLAEAAHFFLAVNRFTIMYFPIRYSKIFTKFNCNLMIIVIVVFAFLMSAPNFWLDCLATFNVHKMAFEVKNTACGYVAIVYLCHHFTICLVCVIAVLDMLTFYKIRQIKKVGHVYSSTQKRGREVRFFFQAVAQGINFVLELILYFEISPYISNKWAVFALTTGSWIGVHTIDGIIVIIFNKRIWIRGTVTTSGEPYSIPNRSRTNS